MPKVTKLFRATAVTRRVKTGPLRALRLLVVGAGSGAFAVARATMPLVFFEKADYAAAMATIALPINLINALAPPVLAALMAGMGAHAVFAALGVLSATAFTVLWQLNRKRSWSTVAE